MPAHRDTPELNDLQSAKSYFLRCFAHSGNEIENLWVAHADERYKVIHLSRHIGDAGGGDFPLRGILIDALRWSTKIILLAHNHPSGDPRPSDSDKRATRRLITVADALGCNVVDHLIFADPSFISMREEGFM